MNKNEVSQAGSNDRFQSKVLVRKGSFHINGAVDAIFPLLCPKKEEDWIPGWECETIHSKSGYNEEGAIFRTTKALETELYWTTLQYDMERRRVDFLVNAPRLFNFRLTIDLADDRAGVTATFAQTFTSLSEEGTAHLDRISRQDYGELLRSLALCINHYLETGTMIHS